MRKKQNVCGKCSWMKIKLSENHIVNNFNLLLLILILRSLLFINNCTCEYPFIWMFIKLKESWSRPVLGFSFSRNAWKSLIIIIIRYFHVWIVHWHIKKMFLHLFSPFRLIPFHSNMNAIEGTMCIYICVINYHQCKKFSF